MKHTILPQGHELACNCVAVNLRPPLTLSHLELYMEALYSCFHIIESSMGEKGEYVFPFYPWGFEGWEEGWEFVLRPKNKPTSLPTDTPPK